MYGESDGLGFQLELYRWEDHFRRMRRIRDENNHIAVAHAEADSMVIKYNDLVDSFNKIASVCDEAIRGAEALEAQIRQKDREIADLRKDLANAEREAKQGLYYMTELFRAENALEELRSQKD